MPDFQIYATPLCVGWFGSFFIVGLRKRVRQVPVSTLDFSAALSAILLVAGVAFLCFKAASNTPSNPAAEAYVTMIQMLSLLLPSALAGAYLHSWSLDQEKGDS